jgi:acetyl-CoA carboxylase biotin carboxyl carrier protein
MRLGLQVANAVSLSEIFCRSRAFAGRPAGRGGARTPHSSLGHHPATGHGSEAGPGAAGGVVELTNEDVADILAVLDSLPYDELDLRTPRFRLTLRRAPGGGWTEESQVFADPVAITPAQSGTAGDRAQDGTAGDSATGAAAGAAGGEAGRGATTRAGTGGTEAGAPAAARKSGTGSDRAGLVAVAAPLPGTFYRAPRPGAAAFVEVGDEVSEDTVVAIVETMKLMNSVHAGTRGRVAEICLENAETAAQGATLMLIEPSA